MEKILKFTFLCFVAMFVFTGCNNSSKDVTENADYINNIVFKIYDTANDITIEEKVNTEKEFSLQDIVDEYRKIYINKGNIPKEYVNSFPNVKVTKKEDSVILSFDKIIENVGSGTEGKYIENLSLAVLDNVNDINKVYINVNGASYESGHILIDVNEVVKQREE